MRLHHPLIHRIRRDHQAAPLDTRSHAGITWYSLPATPPASDTADLPKAPVHRIHALVIDCDRRAVTVQGRPVKLTCMEFELLAYLAAHPHRVHSRESLMEMVWQQSSPDTATTVDTHIARLRHKLGERHQAAIKGIRRKGYAFVPSSAVPDGRPAAGGATTSRVV
ncbi:winged helix-turn-helix domain-containing protein [Streptomyces roseifaciens]